MTKTWLLIAGRSRARILEVGPDKQLTSVHDIDHPEGRLQGREIDADKHGRSFDRMGQGRHAMSTEVSATEHVADRFAKELTDLLHEARTTHQYDQVVLVAEPGFLGRLRAFLDDETGKTVSGAVTKDLVRVPVRELPAHLEGVI